MRRIAEIAFSVTLLVVVTGKTPGQAQDYMLDPRLPLPKTATLDADPYLFLPNEAGKDYQRLKGLLPKQQQKMAHSIGILLKAKIMLEERFNPAELRVVIFEARDEVFDVADMLPEASWLRKTLRGGAQALYDAWSLKAESHGVPILSNSKRAQLIRSYELEDVHPDHHQTRVLTVAHKFISDAVLALSGVQIISPRWSRL